jgi:nucleotide-binding universal stress UspA family protein
MLKLDKILLPIDFSDRNRVAARDAGKLARHFHSEVTLLYVNELLVVHPMTGPLGFGLSSANAAQAGNISRRQQELDAFGTAELTGVKVKRLICSGDPAKLIVEHAHTGGVDLILMPTHGKGAFRRLLLGSVAAKVLHDAECPVWTGTHLGDAPAPSPTEVRHVMCAVNFGPQSAKAVRWAADFASEFGAKLTAVHAVLGTPPNLPDRYMFQWHGEAVGGADERLRALLLESHVQADVLIVDGETPKVLGTALQQQGAGLLVMGRSCVPGRNGRLGSDAYGIICHAPCPVVSI